MESILKEIQQMKERMGSLTTAEDISAMARQINILQDLRSSSDFYHINLPLREF